MKFLMMFLLISATCHATMPASEAAKKSEENKKKGLAQTEINFQNLVDQKIDEAVGDGECETVVYSDRVNDSTLQKEVEMLKRFEYKVTNSVSSYSTILNIKWCKE